jgi:hypothetical protein
MSANRTPKQNVARAPRPQAVNDDTRTLDTTRDIAGYEALLFSLAVDGFDLATAYTVLLEMVKNDDVAALWACIASAVNIRPNVLVTIVNSHITAKYTKLVITGRADVSDSINFSGVHLIGHIILYWAAAAGSPMARRANTKVGNIVAGGPFPQNMAGQINQEYHDSIDTSSNGTYGPQIPSRAFGALVDRTSDFVANFLAKKPALAYSLTANAASASTKVP